MRKRLKFFYRVGIWLKNNEISRKVWDGKSGKKFHKAFDCKKTESANHSGSRNGENPGDDEIPCNSPAYR